MLVDIAEAILGHANGCRVWRPVTGKKHEKTTKSLGNPICKQSMLQQRGFFLYSPPVLMGCVRAVWVVGVVGTPGAAPRRVVLSFPSMSARPPPSLPSGQHLPASASIDRFPAPFLGSATARAQHMLFPIFLSCIESRAGHHSQIFCLDMRNTPTLLFNGTGFGELSLEASYGVWVVYSSPACLAAKVCVREWGATHLVPYLSLGGGAPSEPVWLCAGGEQLARVEGTAV